MDLKIIIINGLDIDFDAICGDRHVSVARYRDLVSLFLDPASLLLKKGGEGENPVRLYRKDFWKSDSERFCSAYQGENVQYKKSKYVGDKQRKP